MFCEPVLLFAVPRAVDDIIAVQGRKVGPAPHDLVVDTDRTRDLREPSRRRLADARTAPRHRRDPYGNEAGHYAGRARARRMKDTAILREEAVVICRVRVLLLVDNFAQQLTAIILMRSAFRD